MLSYPVESAHEQWQYRSLSIKFRWEPTLPSVRYFAKRRIWLSDWSVHWYGCWQIPYLRYRASSRQMSSIWHFCLWRRDASQYAPTSLIPFSPTRQWLPRILPSHSRDAVLHPVLPPKNDGPFQGVFSGNTRFPRWRCVRSRVRMTPGVCTRPDPDELWVVCVVVSFLWCAPFVYEPISGFAAQSIASRKASA